MTDDPSPPEAATVTTATPDMPLAAAVAQFLEEREWEDKIIIDHANRVRSLVPNRRPAWRSPPGC